MFKKLAISVFAIAITAVSLNGIANANTPTGNITTPTFNTLLNTNSYGNEPDFLMVGDTTSNQFDNLHNLCNGEEAYVRIYIHNNAATEYNGQNNDGQGVAHQTTLRVDIPQGPATEFSVTGTVDALNATPTSDSASLACPNPVTLDYIPGTAVIKTATQNWNSVSDTVVTTGALIGTDANDGVWPGCFDEAGFVFLKVKATAVEQPDPEVNLNLKKYINGEDAQDVNSAVELETGETASWKIDVQNTGPDTATNVIVTDAIPNGIGNETNVSATVGSYNANSNVWTIPSLSAGSTASLTFDTEVTAESGTITNVATITGVDQEDKDGPANNTDPAVVIIDNPEIPVNQCTSMILVNTEKHDDQVGATLQVTTNNDDDIVSVVYTITDQDGNSRDITVDGDTNVTTMFDSVGTYTITAVVNFDNKGSSATCSTTLTVKEDTVTVVKEKTVVKEVLGTTVVKELPKTGAGSLAGLFGLSALGASVKGYFTSRKNLKDTLLNR